MTIKDLGLKLRYLQSINEGEKLDPDLTAYQKSRLLGKADVYQEILDLIYNDLLSEEENE